MLSSIVAPAPKHTIAEAVLRHKHSDGSACTGMAKARELTTPPEPFRSELMNSEGMKETFGKGPIAPGRADSSSQGLNGHRQVYSQLWLFPNKGGNIPFKSQSMLDMCANL